MRLPVDDNYRLDLAALASQVAEDKDKGLLPIAVVATAGTVNTGAIDPLDAIADFCAAEGLWMHVDGAFGALAWLDKRQRGQLSGLQRGDSLAFDCHKWLYLPYGVGCVFVRNATAHEATFKVEPPYLSALREGLAAGPFSFPDYGLELSRPFRALKVWLALRAYGARTFAQAISDNIDQAQYLADKIRAEPNLELGAPAALNVVCFRYRKPGLDEPSLDALNARLLRTLQDSGDATPSMTRIRGKFFIRAAITNHRSRLSDCDHLVASVIRRGGELSRER
jgi:glutamate/tyrosine decarboxylase-like PLP-dependent enzyme